MKVFLTSTLHNDFNLSFNPRLTAALEDRGIVVHMPQRDTDQKVPKEKRVVQNMQGVKNTDVSVVVFKNFSMNLAAETGYAAGLGHPVIALVRKGEFIDWMLQGMLSAVIEVDDLGEIESYIDRLVQEIRKYNS